MKQHGKNPSPYVNRGNYHRMLGQPRLAIKDLDHNQFVNVQVLFCLQTL